MITFKFLIPDQIIFKIRKLLTHYHVSMWADSISVEEGWGTQGNNTNYGKNFGVSNMATRVCQPKLVNRMTRKFNKQ